MTHVFTNYLRFMLLDRFLEHIDVERHYVFVSRYTPWADDNNPPDADDTLELGHYGPWREMIYGKAFDSTDCAYLVDKHEWASNTVYTQYDDREALRDTDFFVITDERKVYKCLFNNGEANSTSKPTATANVPFQTADGYTWKYMFTVSQAELDKHSTSTLFPIESNTAIEEASVDGAIDVIVVDTNGNNWIATNEGVVLAKVSNTLIQVANSAQTSNDYYNDSSIYILAGNGAGLLSVITDYVSNSSGNFAVLQTGMSNVTFGSQYLISPQIKITGDGTGAKAYSTVNANTFKIDTINVIDPGSGYRKATVEAIAGDGVSNSSVELRAVIGPPGGHGSDPINELLSQRLSIVVETSNTDSVPVDVDFRTAGILMGPLAFGTEDAFDATEFIQHHSANVSLSVGVVDPFDEDEEVVGQTSGATATVLWSNTTYLLFGDVQGTFANGETIIGSESSVAATISAINTPDLEPYTGLILFVENFEPIERTITSTEAIKLILKT